MVIMSGVSTARHGQAAPFVPMPQGLFLRQAPRSIREAINRGKESGLTEEEVAFYDALADNASAREVMQDDTLKLIARELADRIKAKASLDWTQRETVRADMRRTVRRLLTKYGYPPDAQETATQLVIRQAELMAEGIVSE